MQKIKTIHLAETFSTNGFLHDYRGEEGEMMTVVSASYQTAGRGQGTNKWESERGKNLLFSIKTRPANVPANRQFVMLEAGALSVRDALNKYIKGGVSVKWPNDIYYSDRKISGTLSECTILHGKLEKCITGTGININQRSFPSNIPNAISLYNIIGREVEPSVILRDVTDAFETYLNMIDKGLLDRIHTLYLHGLYRGSGLHKYKDSYGTFLASMANVETDGHLVLKRSDGSISRYAFKEVSFL